MKAELAALAEDLELVVEPPLGSVRVVNDRYCVVIGPERWKVAFGSGPGSPPVAATASLGR
jgi:hypothetical protein